MKKPSFSILIPAYNVERYINRCIESILMQSFINYEILIVNDGSTDNTGSIIDSYIHKDKRIIVYHRQNEGQLASRNFLLNKARGENIIFIDSDDYWESDTLITLHDILKDNKYDLVIFRKQMVNEKENIIAKGPTLFNNNYIIDKTNKKELFNIVVSSSQLNNIWLVCFNNKFRSVLNTDIIRLRTGEDLLQLLNLYVNAENIYYLDKILYNYRINSNSITNNFKNENIYNINYVRSEVLECLKRLGFDDSETINKFYTYYLKIMKSNIINLYKHEKDKNIIMKIVLDIKNHPLFINAIQIINLNQFDIKTRFILKQFIRGNYIIIRFMVKVYNLLRLMHVKD